MLGSEWFSARPGGLNRYYQDLFERTESVTEVRVEGRAFGHPPEIGDTWGSMGGNLLRRVWASRLRSETKFDVVDTHFVLYGLPLRLRTRGRRPVLRVRHFQGPWADESRVAGAHRGVVLLKRALERAVYRQADGFVVLSEDFKRRLVESYGVPNDKIRIISPGVDVGRFQFAAEPTRGRVVCVRRLERRMGIDVLLRAWPRVAAERPGSVLDLIGAGSQRAELESLADSLGIAGSVRFLGRLSDSELVAAYQQAELSVVPSVDLEGFGLIALESMACGTPTIVTDCGGLPDAVRGLSEGLIVDRNNVDALATRLLGALGGDVPERRACRAHAEKFGWDTVVSEHLRWYRELQCA